MKLSSTKKKAAWWKNPSLTTKVFITLALVALYRIGSVIRVPGTDDAAISALREAAKNQGLVGFLNLFSGGAFASFSIFALSVVPFITAGIVVQLLTPAVKRLQEWRDNGLEGANNLKITTRYVAAFLATLQALALVLVLSSGKGNSVLGISQNVPAGMKLLSGGFWFTGLIATLVLVAGTMVLTLFAEIITKKGVGNGTSVIVFAGIISSLPSLFTNVFETKSLLVSIPLCVLCLLVLMAVVKVDLMYRKIPVTFPGSGGRQFQHAQKSHIPLKVNQAGVVPLIIASSFLIFPAAIANVSDPSATGVWGAIVRFLQAHFVTGFSWVYLALSSLLIVFFTFFNNATSPASDPAEHAKQIARQNGNVPGVRPGKDTEAYLTGIVSRLSFAGAMFIAGLAALPYLAFWAAGVANFPFAGTTVLIVVAVSLDLVQSTKEKRVIGDYSAFLKK